jgi:hypothetical protein
VGASALIARTPVSRQLARLMLVNLNRSSTFPVAKPTTAPVAWI